MLFVLLFLLVTGTAQGLNSKAAFDVTSFLVWMAAIAIGGYAASWKAAGGSEPRYWWSSAFTVGIFADLLIVIIHFDLLTSSWQEFSRLSNVVSTLVIMMMTMLAALLGGLIWEKSCPAELR